MEIRFDDKMVEVIEGVHVYVDNVSGTSDSPTLTSWDFLPEDVQEQLTVLTKEINEKVDRMRELIESVPSDGSHGSIEAALNEGYTLEELRAC